MKKGCCGFGHRDTPLSMAETIRSAVEKAAAEGCDTFYTGAMGDFDRMFSSAVRAAKKIYPNIRLICVKPYFSNEINTNAAYYETFYDDVLIPTELFGVHYKAAINARNRWIIDHSDFILIYCVRSFGGANDALKYATKNRKEIIRL